MAHRVLLSTVALTIGVLVLLPAQTPIAGQKPTQGVKAQPAGKTWTPPHTPDGQPTSEPPPRSLSVTI